MKEIEYNREEAVAYALKWALGRNPRYYDFTEIGGDCTNFISQCVYAGCGVMNYEKDYGWYYNNPNDKSPSWTGVSYFYNFMTTNKSVGPFGKVTKLENLVPGDVIQLGDANGFFYHSLFLTTVIPGYRGNRYYICTHTFDAYQRNLFSYEFDQMRCIKILGARKW